MTTSDKLREIAHKYGGAIITGYGQSSASGSTEMFTAEEQCLSDLTALIGEHYVAKEEVDKMVSEMDDDVFDKMNCLIGYLERWLNNPQSNNPPAELRSVIDEAIEYLKSRESHE